MPRFEPQIKHYLEALQTKGFEYAFHGLLEIDKDILPELIETYRHEQNVEIRELLVEVIWEYREKSVIPFLGEALRDPEQRIWRQALNGLVTLASPEAVEVLSGAISYRLENPHKTEAFQKWLLEALEQAEEKLKAA